MGLFSFKKGVVRVQLSLMAGVFLLATLFSLVPVNSVGAATKLANLSPENSAKAFVYYKALRVCLDTAYMKNTITRVVPFPPYLLSDNDLGTMSANDAVNYDWFFTNPPVPQPTDVGVYGDNRDGGDGQHACFGGDQGKRFIAELVALTGYSNGPEFLCDIGFTRQVNSDDCERITQGANNDFVRPSNPEQKLDQWWQETIGASNLGLSALGPGRYTLDWESFQEACKPVEEVGGPLKIARPSEGSSRLIEKSYEYGDRDINNSTSLRLYAGTTTTCGDLVGQLAVGSPVVRAYEAWLAVNVNNEDSEDTQGGIQSEPTCSIDGIGWILCPVLQFAADITDQLYNFLADSFLRIDVQLLSTQGDSNGTYIAWTIMRNLANVAFVIVFLIIIFSQLTSLGVSNYGVKKMLPRIVVAAILVNISFFICQIAVDLSNIAGYGLKTLFEGLGNGLIDPAAPLPANGSADGDAVTWGALTGIIIAGAAVGTGYAALGSLITVLAAALVAILVIFFILILRQVLVVLLIVIAPLAFVAYLLPNTEPLFTKWRKLFTSLLLVFPVIGVVYGASALASNVLQVVYSNADDGLDATVGQIIAGGALIIPLIAVPFILKASLDGFGKLGSMINNLGNKASGAAGKAAGNRFDTSRLGKFQKYRKQQREINRALTQSGAYAGGNPLRKALSDTNQGINSKLGRFGGKLAADGVSLARESEEKAAKDQATLLRSQIASGAMTSEKLDEEAAKAFRSGDRVKTKAIQDVMFEQGGGGMNRYTEAVRKAQSTEGGMSPASFEAMRENINTKHGQLVKTKSAPLSKLAGVGGTLDGHADDIGTWAMSAGDLAGQTGAQLQYAADRQLINPKVARAMMKDARIRERLDPDQQAALTKASQETDASYSERVVQADTKKKKTAQDAAFATYEAAGNVQTYRQAGEAKVEVAAQGSAGSAPFVVDSSGSVTSNTSSGRVRSIQVEAAEGTSSGGVFVVDRTGTTEAPAAPEPSVLDVNPDAAQTVADLNNPYRTMDRTSPAPIDPADVSGVFGGGGTTSIDIPITVTPEPRVAPNPFTSMEQPGLQNPVDPADISPLTGQSNIESIDIPLNDEEKK